MVNAMAKTQTAAPTSTPTANAARDQTQQQVQAAHSNAGTATSTRPTTVNQNDTDNIDFENLDVDAKRKYLEDIPEKDRTEAQNTLLKSLKKTKDPTKDNTGDINKWFRDPDDGEPEKGKFDVQQGDFIEFLMKEVVIASMAYTGDKLSSYAGYYTYKGISKVYHGVTDNWNENIHAPAMKKAEEIRKAVKESFQNTDKQKARATIQEDDTVINDNDDATTKFAKQMYQMHNNKLNGNEIYNNRKKLREAIGLAIDGKIDEINLIGADGQPLGKDSVMYKSLLKIAANSAGMVDKDKDMAKEKVAEMIMAQSYNVMMLNTFSSCYSTARLLDEKSKNPKAFDGQEPEILKRKYDEEGRKFFYIEMLKINRGTSEFKSMDEFLNLSVNAFETAKKNIKNHDYIREDGKGSYPENKDFKRLDNIFRGTDSSLRDRSEADLLTNVTQTMNAREASLMQQLARANQECQAADDEADRHNAGRKRSSNENSVGNNSSRQQTPPTQRRGNEH